MIATEYKNQSSPSSFYTLYPENATQVLPSAITLYASQSQQFVALGQSACSATSANWTISPASLGTISASGLYTAPAGIVTQQTATVTGISQADGSTIGSAAVTLMPPLSISVSPTSGALVYGTYTLQFVASVENATDTAVTWSITPAGLGKISATGLYSAPDKSFPPQTVTITATSQADPTKSASATIMLSSPNVTVSPSPVTISTPGETVQFTATTTNISQSAVTWTVDYANLGTSVGGEGSVSSTGLYTAPPSIETPQSFCVYAWILVGSGSQGACGRVNLVPKAAIAVTPASSTLYAGQSQQLKATVTNESNTGVTWALNPAGVGSISAAGLYIAPPNVTAQQTILITATSMADASLSATVPLVLEPSLPSSAQCWSGYAYQRSIVIDHTRIPHTDQVNFPFLFNTTDPSFRTTANGGHVTSAAGYDIAFSTDPKGERC